MGTDKQQCCDYGYEACISYDDCRDYRTALRSNSEKYISFTKPIFGICISLTILTLVYLAAKQIAQRRRRQRVQRAVEYPTFIVTEEYISLNESLLYEGSENFCNICVNHRPELTRWITLPCRHTFHAEHFREGITTCPDCSVGPHSDEET